MKTHNPLLKLSVCLALGGMVTVGIICFLIGFGIHSPVGKYALYTALFLQSVCLLVNRIAERPYRSSHASYTPSPKMVRFHLTAELLWTLGAILLLGALLLILLGMAPADLWIRRLTVCGILLSPIGWLGLLIASYRRRTAVESQLLHNH